MSFDTNVRDLSVRIGQEFKAIREELKEKFLETTIPANQQLGAGTVYMDIAPFDTPQSELNTLTGITFDTANGESLCSLAGLYRFDFETALDQYDGNNRTSARVRLVLNGVLVKGTEKISYHRQNLHGFGSYKFTRTLNLVPGDIVKVQARNEDGTRSHQLLADSTLLRIIKINN